MVMEASPGLKIAEKLLVSSKGDRFCAVPIHFLVRGGEGAGAGRGVEAEKNMVPVVAEKGIGPVEIGEKGDGSIVPGI